MLRNQSNPVLIAHNDQSLPFCQGKPFHDTFGKVNPALFSHRSKSPDVFPDRSGRQLSDAFQALGPDKAVDRRPVNFCKQAALFNIRNGCAVFPFRVSLSRNAYPFSDFFLCIPVNITKHHQVFFQHCSIPLFII